MDLTQEAILSFLLDHGGKVKNSDLLNHFRRRINSDDPAETQRNRDLFKKLVNSVAFVKTLDEIKFVVVKKRYMDFIRDARCASPKAHMDQSYSGENASFYASPHRSHRSHSVKVLYSDVQNNNTCALNLNDNYVCDSAPRDGAQSERLKLSRSASCVDAATVRVLNFPGHQEKRVGRAASVFAVVAVSPPLRTSAAVNAAQATEELTVVTRVSPPKLPPSACPPVCKSGGASGWSCGQTHDAQPAEAPPERPPSGTDSKQGEETRHSESVPLDPLAHEWLVKCAAGLWGQVYAMLLQDIHLAQRKDFMSGFTVLHWAAKAGNCEIIKKILNVIRERRAFVNINTKAHGGYTPLHVAAIHGRTEVMFLLVQGYGANVNVRDNDGKKAFHSLGNNASAEVRALLGAQARSGSCNQKYEEESRKQLRNAMSKRFNPHKGKKHRETKKYAQDW